MKEGIFIIEKTCGRRLTGDSREKKIMDLRQIEYILKIAETKNVSKAAKELYITQSALNQQLLKLEKELGTPLFFRDRRHWELTPAGTVYTEGAKEILQIKKNTYHRIADQQESAERSFSLGIPAGRGIRMFTEIYPRFTELCPGAAVSPIEMSSYEQQDLLLSGRLDLGFLTIGEEKKSGLNYEHVCYEELFAAVPAGHPAAEQAWRESGEDRPLLRGDPGVLLQRIREYPAVQACAETCLGDDLLQFCTGVSEPAAQDLHPSGEGVLGNLL